MADRLRVTELDFDTIKNNLKTFLKQQSEFSDYDFEGSGLNILIDLLAYNTHYNAYYLNMVANESFLDSALLRDSVVSHAKSLGYTPYSTKAPVAILNVSATSDLSQDGIATIPRGFSFLSNQIDGKSYSFVVLEETTATKANSQYFFENLEIYEGQLVSFNYVYDQSSNPKQIFTLPDENIDSSTITVTVAPQVGNTSLEVYNQVTDIIDVTGESEVYFLQESRTGYYQIYFGNGSVGKALPDGAVVYVSYLSTNGSFANKANNFVASEGFGDTNLEYLTELTITPISAAAGGTSKEPIDSVKLNAISQYSSQNRLVTIKDYEALIKKNYPAVDSVSVWGGEDQEPKIYGKVFLSLKPKDGYFISQAEKQRIIDEIIIPKSIVSISSEIVDPDYLYLIIGTKVQYDRRRTTLSPESLKQAIKNAINIYKSTYLNRFAATLIVSRLQDAIDSVDNSIIGNDLTLRVQKRFDPLLNITASYTIDFQVPLQRGTTLNKLASSEFQVYDTSNVLRTVTLEEVPQSYTGISSIQVSNAGLGYTSAPTVTITGDGSGAEAEAKIVNGRVESIAITKRGTDYSRAVVTITGGGGSGAEALAVIDNLTGTLRTVYFDSNAERKIVNPNVGSIDYSTGKIIINDTKIISALTSDGKIRISAESEMGIIESVRNTILTIDPADSGAISIELEQA